MQLTLEDHAGSHGQRTRDFKRLNFLPSLGENPFVDLAPEFDLQYLERLASANEEVNLATFLGVRRTPAIGAGV
jgi:hypothetical protein